ncbi:MAG: ABC transporter permease subunit [Pedobacter sp.]|nr:MAG: ABC transporter permease subunit [Pedobacter sp.]
MNELTMHLKQRSLHITGLFLAPILWIGCKSMFNISDSYLPSFNSVLDAFITLKPNIAIHLGWSFGRLVIGFIGGISVGLFLGLFLFKYNNFKLLLYPLIQSIRSIPAAATIPFFLLWFGFDEVGKFLLIFLGIAFNLAITTLEILNQIPEKYLIMFNSYNSSAKNKIRKFSLPFVMEKILPTLRFSLSTSIGLVVISEILGSQVGLGYLIETARSTFSMNVIFAATILFGVVNFIMDKGLIYYWNKLIYWKL